MRIPVYKITAVEADTEIIDTRFCAGLLGLTCEIMNVTSGAPAQLILYGEEGPVRMITDPVTGYCVHDDITELETVILPDVMLRYDGDIQHNAPAWVSCEILPRVMLTDDGMVGIAPGVFCRRDEDDFDDEEEDENV